VIGAWLRLRLAESYAPTWSYDYTPHLQYLEHVADTGGLPPLSAHRAAYNPPLFYLLGGAVLGREGTLEDVQLISIGAGVVTLALIWLGLRRFLQHDPIARLIALSLAAVLPCAIHMQGMISNEALLGALATATLLWVRPAFEAAPMRRWLSSGALGLTLALALLTKISPILFCIAIGFGVLLDATWKRRLGARNAWRRLAPVVCGSVLALGIALPVHARHYADSGRLFPTGYDSINVRPVAHIPYLARRPISFYVAPCAGEIFKRPYYPSCSEPDARFWPVLVASTFGDYYNFRYAGMPRGAEPVIEANHRLLSVRALWLMRAAVAAGALIALGTIGGTLAGMVSAIRRHDVARSVLLSASILAIFAQLAFTIQFPYDGFGPIKGSYLQFASAPLFAAFGVACSWLWQRPRFRVLAVAQIGAVFVVAVYSVYARWHGFY